MSREADAGSFGGGHRSAEKAAQPVPQLVAAVAADARQGRQPLNARRIEGADASPPAPVVVEQPITL